MLARLLIRWPPARALILLTVLVLVVGAGGPGRGSPDAVASSGPTVIATIPVGSWPWAVAVNPPTDRVYVANVGSFNVSVIDGGSNTLQATVPVGTQPCGVTVNPTTNLIYVANYGDDTVSVI
jgi:YVTN family beta-propeller protein